MIRHLQLQFGQIGRGEQLGIEPGSVTIFVGPNNSGKSLVLREIEVYCRSGLKTQFQIVESLDFDLDQGLDVENTLVEMDVPFKEGELARPDQIRYGRFNASQGFMTKTIEKQSLLSWMSQGIHFRHFIEYYVSMFVSRFGGKERFQLVENKPTQNLKSHPANSLAGLFQDDSKRAEVRELLFEAFGKYFVIDATSMSSFEIRFSDTPPPSAEVERGWTDSSVKFHNAAKHINAHSDGIQAFTGLVMTIVAGEEKIMLLDEPEAFLHPSLATLLGKKIAALMADRSGNLFVSTHSPFFVMGCLQSGKKINIVRLTYGQAGNPTARLLKPADVVELFKNPLLRSTGLIQALFYSTVVIGESDADRAFYNEINERLIGESPSEGMSNVLFLNAQNKQTIWDILKPLRDMGIPAVGIVDIDFIKDGGQSFTKALKSARVPSTLHDSLQSMRAKLKSQFDSSGRDMKREGGIELLVGDNRALADKFVKDLSDYGIFIVPGGELESWLKVLKCSGHGPSWLIQIFGLMGSDPLEPNYSRPSHGDVWNFIRQITSWVSNPKRNGM